jgi:hypothetical protein
VIACSPEENLLGVDDFFTPNLLKETSIEAWSFEADEEYGESNLFGFADHSAHASGRGSPLGGMVFLCHASKAPHRGARADLLAVACGTAPRPLSTQVGAVTFLNVFVLNQEKQYEDQLWSTGSGSCCALHGLWAFGGS